MLSTICDFLDDFLEIREIEDYPNAINGLQLENNGRVTKIGAAVDASEATIELAIGENVDLLFGIVTGGGGNLLDKVAARGIDTFVTGEGPHHTFALAEERKVNLIYGGHYATETFGVRALAARTAAEFELPWCFLDHRSSL
jgi:putative NIF3 family GTP cyclohydrolase 1 type 2